MKKTIFLVLFLLCSLVSLAQTYTRENMERIDQRELRQLCVGSNHKVTAKYCYYKPGGAVAAGRKVKGWVNDKDGTLWGHNNTDYDDLTVYIKYVDKNGEEHSIFRSLPKGTLPNHNAQQLATNASYVIEVGYKRD